MWCFWARANLQRPKPRLELGEPNQKVPVIASDNYACLVPFVEESGHFFLKTTIPSRKATRDYLNQEDRNAKN